MKFLTGLICGIGTVVRAVLGGRQTIYGEGQPLAVHSPEEHYRVVHHQ